MSDQRDAETNVVTAVDIDGGLLVGDDGSTAAREAVTFAAGLASRLGLPLHVLRAWSITSAPRPESMQGGYVPPLADFEAAVLAAVHADLDGLELPDVEIHVHAARRAAARALLEAADGVEMIVVGSRGAGGFRGLGFGSTADQVVRHSPRPVVVVPTTAR